MELIGKVRALFETKRQTAEQSYLDSVKAVAAGKGVKPEEAAKLIEAAGKTLAEFESDVRDATRRLQLKAVAITMPAAEAEVDALKGKIAALDKKIADFIAQVQSEAAPLTVALAEAERKLSAAKQALGTLAGDPEPNPERDAAMRAANEKVRQAIGDRDRAKSAFERVAGEFSRKANERATRWYQPIGSQDRARFDPDEKKLVDDLEEQLNAAEAFLKAAVEDRENIQANLAVA